jgi:hypothetical protein
MCCASSVSHRRGSCAVSRWVLILEAARRYYRSAFSGEESRPTLGLPEQFSNGARYLGVGSCPTRTP